jgi:hypothetical protein
VRFRINLHTAMACLFQRPNGADADATRACLQEAVLLLEHMRATLAPAPPGFGENSGGDDNNNSNSGGTWQTLPAASSNAC